MNELPHQEKTREERFLSDVIGKSFMGWNPRDVIFLDAPTGSGKTTFIINYLLPYASSQGKKVLYVANRKILIDQIKYKVSFIYANHIEFVSYQTIEKSIKEHYKYSTSDYDYIVMDEAHYFLEDALFNPSTELSLDVICNYINSARGVTIFLSATGEKFKDYFKFYYKLKYGYVIIDKPGVYNDNHDESYMPNSRGFEEPITDLNNLYPGKIKGIEDYMKGDEYRIYRDYNYLEVHPFYDIDAIPEIINSAGGKWLVFLNRKDKCEEFKKIVEGSDYIDSGKRRKRDAVIDDIETEEKIPEDIDVLFTTSVMENGVSLNDSALRNMIIVADTKEQLIQMIGRKRSDGKKVKLYLYTKSALFLSNKKRFLCKRYDFYNRLLSVKGEINRGTIIDSFLFANKLFEWSSSIEDFKRITYILNYSYYKDEEKGWVQSNFPMFCLSRTTYDELSYRIGLFDDEIKKIENDNMSFYKTQLRWLGFGEELINDNVSKNSFNEKEMAKCEIKDIIYENLDMQMGKEEFGNFTVEQFGSVYSTYKHVLSFPEESKNKIVDALTKRDHKFTPESFSAFCESVGLGDEFALVQIKKRNKITDYIIVKEGTDLEDEIEADVEKNNDI